MCHGRLARPCSPSSLPAASEETPDTAGQASRGTTEQPAPSGSAGASPSPASTRRNVVPGGLRLRAAGGSLPADEPFLRAVRQRLADAGLARDAEFLPNLDRPSKQAFFRTLSVLSVPTRHGEAFGMYVLESLASGVPVVLPRHGAFPELVEATGGGLLYDPEEPGALAAALQQVLSDPELARQLAARGRQAVFDHFDVRQTAQQVVSLLEGIVSKER